MFYCFRVVDLGLVTWFIRVFVRLYPVMFLNVFALPRIADCRAFVAEGALFGLYRVTLSNGKNPNEVPLSSPITIIEVDVKSFVILAILLFFAIRPKNSDPSGVLDFSGIKSDKTIIDMELTDVSNVYSMHMYYTGYKTMKFENGFMRFA